jgi:hypothetical protein
MMDLLVTQNSLMQVALNQALARMETVVNAQIQNQPVIPQVQQPPEIPEAPVAPPVPVLQGGRIPVEDNPRNEWQRQLEQEVVARPVARAEGQTVPVPRLLDAQHACTPPAAVAAAVAAGPHNAKEHLQNAFNQMDRHRSLRPGDKRRGTMNKKEHIDQVMQKIYRREAMEPFFKQIWEGHLFLHMQTPFINNRVFFARDNRNIVKIKRTLNLMDALWTPEERLIICTHSMQEGDAQCLFREISVRCQRADHVIEQLCIYDKEENPKTLPRSADPSNKAGAQILGLANAITGFPIERNVPNWQDQQPDGSYPRDFERALMEYVTDERVCLQGLIDAQN